MKKKSKSYEAYAIGRTEGFKNGLAKAIDIIEKNMLGKLESFPDAEKCSELNRGQVKVGRRIQALLAAIDCAAE